MNSGHSDDLTKYYGFVGRSTGQSTKLKKINVPRATPVVSTSNILKYEDFIHTTNNIRNSRDGVCTVTDYSAKDILKTSGNITTGLTKKVSKNIRPSLTEQLASIGEKADALTKSIRENAGMKPLTEKDVPLFSTPSSNFNVGRLSCRYPSPVHFYRNRVEYTFHHPYEATEIAMIMYYQDMSQVILPSNSPFRLAFRLPHRLIHFGDDYDPSKMDSVVAIDFPTGLAVTQIRQKVLPLITSKR